MIADEFYGAGTHVCGQVFHLNPAGSVETGEDGFLYRGARAETAFYRLKPSEGGGAEGMELEEMCIRDRFWTVRWMPRWRL